ncbi:MAG TPA: hypothetical protein PKD78_15610, partial [Saprospiraceae bacterium]|nr:hypothetical protein [Saprospiraceae bacterium]
MKKANLRLRLRDWWCAGLLLCALCTSPLPAQAQNLQTQAQQNANWVSASTAAALLEDNIETVHAQLPGLVEGTQPHDNALRRVAYYK